MDVLYLDIAQALVLIFARVVVYYAYRAFSKSRSQAMLLLAIGFAFVALGAVIAGVLYNFVVGTDLDMVLTLQAYIQVVGFFIIVYSLARAKG